MINKHTMGRVLVWVAIALFMVYVVVVSYWGFTGDLDGLVLTYICAVLVIPSICILGLTLWD